jgi:hypothetical protein
MLPSTQRPSTPVEILVGRSLAVCVHPYAAWPLLSNGGRAFVFAAYAAAGYAVVLGALQLISF